MNPYYLLSVIGSRIFNLLSIIIISYILVADDYGKYSLVCTNALFLHVFFTSWICSNLWKDVSQAEFIARDVMVSEAMSMVSIAIIANALTAGLLFYILRDDQRYLASIFVLSPFILFIEVTLVILNAQGEDRAYGWLSFARGILCLSLSVILAVFASSLLGAIFGQILGILAALLFSGRARSAIQHATFKYPTWKAILPKLRFGLVSATALNFYMVANGLIRNLIAVDLGEAAAGHYSMASDLFYAPVALFAMTLSLMKTPDLYKANACETLFDPQPSIDFVMANIALALPYAVGGVMVAPLVATMMLSKDAAAAVSLIAAYGAVQGACFVIISTLTTLALTQGRVRSALMVSVCSLLVLLVAVVLALGSGGVIAYAENVTVGLLLIVVSCLTISWRHFGMKLSVVELGKIISACVAMAAAIWVVLKLIPGYWGGVVAPVAGVSTFVAISLLCRSRVVAELLNARSNTRPQQRVF